VFVAAAALLGALNALVWSMYKSEVDAVASGLDDRLTALGTTAARYLASDHDASGLLAELVAANRLEDAYVVDRDLHVTAGVRTRAGSRLNLLRVDPDRLASDTASVGSGYSVENAAVEAAYFPFVRGGARYVLSLEAGAEYHAPEAQLRARYLVAVGLSGLVAVVFAVALWLALRALERERIAHGRAERLAAVGQMAAMVAHEVRNPLGILRGQVELARERIGDAVGPRERERFAEMLAEIERLNTLTEEFLGLARDLPLHVASVELNELATAIADEARIAAANTRIEIAPCEEPLTISGDAARLRQAILNLVLNAVQIGGTGVTVRVETARAGDRIRVTVADDGPGVPPELAPTLFEPFVGARPGGSGLGLAVARRVAERHGGSLVLESSSGSRGARFSMYLPGRGSS
jgi:signal transduction histidine kinase